MPSASIFPSFDMSSADSDDMSAAAALEAFRILEGTSILSLAFSAACVHCPPVHMMAPNSARQGVGRDHPTGRLVQLAPP
jgi:hypothetical protein